MPVRAVIYLRTARAEPEASGESRSITRQRHICRQAAAALGAAVVGEYVDNGVSGTTLDRPGLGACLARVEAKPRVDYLVVTDLSRLGRGVDRHSDTPIAAEAARRVTRRGVTLHLAAERRNHAAGNGILDLVGSLAQRRPSP
jgi:DNA invertase Pin-like site-specific DNA recombinase